MFRLIITVLFSHQAANRKHTEYKALDRAGSDDLCSIPALALWCWADNHCSLRVCASTVQHQGCVSSDAFTRV